MCSPLPKQANEQDKAVKLAQSASEANVLRFGKGRMVPKQQFSLQELRLNKIQPEKLLSPKDNTLDGVRRTLQIGVLGAVAGSFVAFDLPPSSLFWLALAVSFLYVGDQVAFRGGASALLLDSAGRVLRPEYAQR